MISDAIKKAIADGEAALAEKKAADELKKKQEEGARAEIRMQLIEQARGWVATYLPDKIRELTAAGIRVLEVDEYHAIACQEIGMRTKRSDSDSWAGQIGYYVYW